MKKRSLLKDRVFGALKGFINEQATSPGVAVDFKICSNFHYNLFLTVISSNKTIGSPISFLGLLAS